MTWKKKRNEYKGKNYYYSLRNKLKRDKKITDDFEVMLSSLTLEELIGLKLEIASSYINNKLYNIPIYKSLLYITREAVVKYALSSCRSIKDSASFLGIHEANLREEMKKLNLSFDEENYD